jgi:hypothetical protein
LKQETLIFMLEMVKLVIFLLPRGVVYKPDQTLSNKLLLSKQCQTQYPQVKLCFSVVCAGNRLIEIKAKHALLCA